MMNKKTLIILFSLILIAAVALGFAFKKRISHQTAIPTKQTQVKPSDDSSDEQGSEESVDAETLNGYQTISWSLLYKLDYKTGKMPEAVRKLDGRTVKIPGFLVPLADNHSELSEFLVVPDGQSCIHVPPPPPNLIIQAKLKQSIPVKEAFSPAWVYGTLKIQTVKSEFGSASYQMSVDRIIEYR